MFFSFSLFRIFAPAQEDGGAEDVLPKTLLELAAEPEFNEEICRLARWQRQGIKAEQMAGRRQVTATHM